jgi:broad specificity phosphatase PhoE
MASTPVTPHPCEFAGFGERAAIDRDLMEGHYGAYEGFTTVQIQAHAPGWMLFSDGCPGGESPEQLDVQVDRAIARVRAVHGHVALCVHGHFLESLRLGGVDFQPQQGVLPARYGDAQILSSYQDTPALQRWNARLREPPSAWRR